MVEKSSRTDFSLLEEMFKGVASIVERPSKMERNPAGSEKWRCCPRHLTRKSQSSLAPCKSTGSFPRPGWTFRAVKLQVGKETIVRPISKCGPFHWSPFKDESLFNKFTGTVTVLHPVKKGENEQKTLQLRFFHKFF